MIMNINKLAVEDEENDPNLIIQDGKKKGEEKGEKVNVNKGNWEVLWLNTTKEKVEEKLGEEVNVNKSDQEALLLKVKNTIKKEMEREEAKKEKENGEKEEKKQHLLQNEDATPIGRSKKRKVLSQIALKSHITNKFYQMLHN